MKTPLTLALLLSLAAPVFAEPVVLTSPGGNLKVTVNDGDRLTYEVSESGVPVLASSPLGITVDGEDLGEKAVNGIPARRQVKGTYRIHGNHTSADMNANEMTIPVESHGKLYGLQVRVQDDGVGVRYLLQPEMKHIDGESTGWRIAGAKQAGWQDFVPCYEGNDHWTDFSKVPEGKRVSGLMTVRTADHYLFLSEADNANAPDFAFVRKGDTLTTVWYAEPKGYAADSPERHATPWRTTTVAKDLTTLVNSDLLTNLCPPPDKSIDWSFVKPGRILWQWCSVGAPKYADQRDWYDAAAKLKWEYYMIDDGWRDWKKPGQDKWTLLKEVIDYGKTKGVETIIWVDSKELIKSPEARDAYLAKVKACGAVGIKIDFIPDASAKVMQWYDDTLSETAKLGIMTIFHGCTKPTGRVRTRPHALTREGIRGNEWQMTRYKRVQAFDHDVTQPFTRFLAGAGDITPLVADPVQLNGYTLPHMVAQTIVSTSPLQCFYDQYKFYVGSPIEDLLREIPVTWDETRVLPGTEPGKAVGFARRKGDTWWLGVMNGGEATQFTVALDFLKTPAKATLGEDSRTASAVMRAETTVQPGEKIELNLRRGGGWFARIKATN